KIHPSTIFWGKEERPQFCNETLGMAPHRPGPSGSLLYLPVMRLDLSYWRNIQDGVIALTECWSCGSTTSECYAPCECLRCVDVNAFYAWKNRESETGEDSPHNNWD